eukprot:1139977-Pelagomonas_calceolata.AAC.2
MSFCTHSPECQNIQIKLPVCLARHPLYCLVENACPKSGPHLKQNKSGKIHTEVAKCIRLPQPQQEERSCSELPSPGNPKMRLP